MRTVHKFNAYHGEFEAEMPEGAQIVHFADQNGELRIWAIVDTSRPIDRRYFRVAGTGHEVSAEYDAHWGTCQQGPFVWHLFENTSDG
jgi:hypothetical protein